MLIARSVNKQLFACLKHVGVSLSYDQTMERVRLVREAPTDIKLEAGLWITVFDNVNFQKESSPRAKTKANRIMGL